MEQTILPTILYIYFAFFLIGTVGLGSSFILGVDGDNDLAGGDVDGHFDSGDTVHDSPKVFSLRVIFSFLSSFAVGGGAMFFSEKSLGAQILVGLLAGVLTAAFTWWLASILYKQQGSSNINSDNFIGMSGDIIIGTTAAGKSKVRLNTHGGAMELMCKEANDKVLKAGDLVDISGKIGNLLIVSKRVPPSKKKIKNQN
jgi:hypothetical protein